MTEPITIHPLTPQRWPDFETLFGPRGATGGCWCMFFRLPNRLYRENTGENNRRAIKDIVETRTPPGLLAYEGDQAVGWCAVAPREVYKRLERSKILKPVDDQPVWAITCFFVARRHRRKGVTRKLIEAAVAFVKKQGGKIVEAYPVDTAARSKTRTDLYPASSGVDKAARSNTRTDLYPASSGVDKAARSKTRTDLYPASSGVDKAARRKTRTDQYPASSGVDKSGTEADTFMYHGVASAFRAAGFGEVGRRSETRPIMRYVIE